MKQYNQKRDFSKTSEPEGRVEKSIGKLHFVVQHHLARREHYDLRLEWNGVLLSWAVPKGPSLNPMDKRLAIHVEDHPLQYRRFEGEIPKGSYGGGMVTIWDKGYYEMLEHKDSAVKFILFGEKLKGKWALIRTKEKNHWLLIKEADDLDSSFKLQLCTSVNQLPKGDDWIYEMKYDGYRILAANGRLMSRNGKDWTDKFKSIAVPANMVLDGEVVGESFGSLRRGDNVAYIVFDILWLDSEDLRSVPLINRKRTLQDAVGGKYQNVQCCDYMTQFTQADFNKLCSAGYEGIVAKRINSKYSGGRSGDWVKLKCRPHAVTPQVIISKKGVT
jgi:bifunctional non-homologous end joining protein LigD